VISGRGADWLESRREELNQRFLLARRRHPTLAPAPVLALLARAIPPLADRGASPALLSAIYDLVLLHAGRDALATHPGLAVLLFDAFPALLPLLERRPAALVAALSNAVENLGPRGDAFARGLVNLAGGLDDPGLFLKACAVMAWRLGDPRLRVGALAVASALPPRTLLRALALDPWPDPAAPVALAALETDAWQLPADRLSPSTLAALLRAPEERAGAVEAALRSAAPPLLSRWRGASQVGAFTGFGGAFDAPPIVLDGGDRHTLHVRAGDGFFLVEADCFGWRCRPEPDPQLPVRRPEARGALSRIVGRLTSAGEAARLMPDGTFELDGEAARIPELEGSTAYSYAPGRLAVTGADSHHVRVLVAWRDAL
jgi:hypothetical protein